MAHNKWAVILVVAAKRFAGYGGRFPVVVCGRFFRRRSHASLRFLRIIGAGELDG